jgi:hypothetical protein
MQKIIYRALKVVYNDHSSSCEELLQKCDMDSLELMRQKTLLCEVFKFINNIGPEYMNDIFQIHRESRRGLLLVEHRVRSTLHGTHSVRALGPKMWNSLPPPIKSSKTICEFKSRLKDFTGMGCKCAQCR